MISFFISFGVTALLTPAVILLARRFGWVAAPREDRWHSRPTALMGGIAIFVGTVAAWLAGGDLGRIAPVAVPAAGMFALGLVDDRLRLRAHVKLIGQVAAAALLTMAGVRFEGLPPALSLLLTLMWIVGITNAVNLLDNMDGLAAGVCLIAGVSTALYAPGHETAPLVLAVAGGCAGFLIYNFNPARIFMGDCGSMFLGFSLAALAIQGTHRSAPNLAISFFAPVAVLAIPIFDTTLVSVARMLHGRAISQGGRDHVSHRLVSLGLSERATVLGFYVLTAVFGGLALLATRLTLLVTAVLAVLLFGGLSALGLFLGFLKVYPDDSGVPPHERLLGGGPLYKKQVLQVLLDMPLVPVAFVAAYLLRFEGAIPPPLKETMMAALPIILSTKLIGLALCGAYRGVWRYAGIDDALRAAIGSVLGSLIAAGVLGVLTGFKDVSRATLIIDWLLFTVLVVAARTGCVVLRHLFGMLPPRNGPTVVILGVGTEALTLVQKLRDPLSSHRAAVVGILDDDPQKHGCTLNGVPVLGPLSELTTVLQTRNVNCCVLGVAPWSEAAEAILDFCGRRKIAVYADLESPALHPREDLLTPATA
jgi:UDP-GlcNAc:undecaprenyl-phosphate/decaprenyl-phosphate GlcNAc-1-phosphate transferase